MMNQIAGMERDPNKNTMALISMILGICCMVFGIFLVLVVPFGSLIGVLLSGAAIVLGIKSLNSERRGFAITGIATGSFAGLIYALFVLLNLLALLGIGILTGLLGSMGS